MITDFKIYETVRSDKTLEVFFETMQKNFTEHSFPYKKCEEYYLESKLDYEFQDEFKILFFLYNPYGWKHYNPWDFKEENKYVNTQVKKYVRNSIIKKFTDNLDLYEPLKNNEQVNGKNYYDDFMKYVYFTFHTALKSKPDFLKNTEKYMI